MLGAARGCAAIMAAEECDEEYEEEYEGDDDAEVEVGAEEQGADGGASVPDPSSPDAAAELRAVRAEGALQAARSEVSTLHGCVD